MNNISKSEATSSNGHLACQQSAESSTEGNADPADLSPLLRGMVWGGFLTLGAALVLLGIRRLQKQEMVFNGELGSIRISQSALEKLMSSHCEKISGVVEIDCQVRMRGQGVHVILNTCLKPDCDPSSVMARVVFEVYERIGSLLSLTPEGLEVSVREVKLQQAGG